MVESKHDNFDVHCIDSVLNNQWVKLELLVSLFVLSECLTVWMITSIVELSTKT